jgi:RNA polymerase sigma-70 factor, ECF subfamily
MSEQLVMQSMARAKVREGGIGDADAVGDAAVIERSIREPAAFALVYDRHASEIFRFAARRLGRQAAEDVMADTFLDAFSKRHRYDLTRRDCRPWLYGIASNVIGKQRRTEVRRFRALARSAAMTGNSCDLDEIDERIWAGASRAELAAALAALSRKHRDVVLLVAWADLSYDEVSVALKIPVGTVRSRLNRARRALRSALTGLQDDPTIEELPHA